MLQIITDGLPGRGGRRLVIMAAALLRNAAAASREQQYFSEHTGLAWQLMGTPGPHESVPREVEASRWCLSDSRVCPHWPKKPIPQDVPEPTVLWKEQRLAVNAKRLGVLLWGA